MAKLPPSTTTKTYSPRDIGGAINNALLAASRPESFEIRESRLRRLSEYAAALVEPVKKHLETEKPNGEPLITYHEAVVALLSAALLVHAANTTGGDKLPLMSVAKLLKKG